VKSLLAHWNGRAWSRAGTVPVGVLGPGDLTGDGSGGIWVDSLSAGIMHAGGVVVHKDATTQAAILEYTP
jgi:hypothetical protein